MLALDGVSQKQGSRCSNGLPGLFRVIPLFFPVFFFSSSMMPPFCKAAGSKRFIEICEATMIRFQFLVFPHLCCLYTKAPEERLKKQCINYPHNLFEVTGVGKIPYFKWELDCKILASICLQSCNTCPFCTTEVVEVASAPFPSLWSTEAATIYCCLDKSSAHLECYRKPISLHSGVQ